MWVNGSFVQVFERGALLCNGLLLEGVGTSAHAKRCEANLSYDTSYLYMFKCCENFRMVDSLDSDLYRHSISRYISHSFSPNVAAKARMIAGTPTVLPNAACYTIPGTHVLIDYGRTSVPAGLAFQKGGGTLLSWPMKLLVPALPRLPRQPLH